MRVLTLLLPLCLCASAQQVVVHVSAPVVRQGQLVRVMLVEGGERLESLSFENAEAEGLRVLTAPGVQFSLNRGQSGELRWEFRNGDWSQPFALLIGGGVATPQILLTQGRRGDESLPVFLQSDGDREVAEVAVSALLRRLWDLPETERPQYWKSLCAAEVAPVGGCALRGYFPHHGPGDKGGVLVTPPLRVDGPELSTVAVASADAGPPIKEARLSIAPADFYEVFSASGGTQLRLEYLSHQKARLVITKSSDEEFGGLAQKRLYGIDGKADELQCFSAEDREVSCTSVNWKTMFREDEEQELLSAILAPIIRRMRERPEGFGLDRPNPPGVEAAQRRAVSAPAVSSVPLLPKQVSRQLLSADSQQGSPSVWLEYAGNSPRRGTESYVVRTNALGLSGVEVHFQVTPGVEVVSISPGSSISAARKHFETVTKGTTLIARAYSIGFDLITPGEISVVTIRRKTRRAPLGQFGLADAVGVTPNGEEIRFFVNSVVQQITRTYGIQEPITPGWLRTVGGESIESMLYTTLLSPSKYKPFNTGSGSPCDIDNNGSCNVLDVQLLVNMSLLKTACTANVAGPLTCNVVAIQRVVNAALGKPCVWTHFASLTWVDSPSQGVVGYHVYRSASCTGTFTKVSTSLVTAKPWYDVPLTGGQSICYRMTAINGQNVESALSDPSDNGVAQVVPLP